MLFIAIENKCHRVVKFLLDVLFRHGFKRTFPCSDQKKESGRLMVETWPHLISEHNQNEKTPLEIASEEGTSWLVESILQKDRSSILRTPKVWVEACRKGHLQTILAFVGKSTYLRYVCRESHDTPLHHVEFQDYTSYQELLQRPVIQELKNNQDSDCDTPLHKAVKKRNKDLTEILFTMEDIYWNIKHNDQKTALDLLEQDRLCKVIGVDPQLKITYIQRKKDVTEMQETISLVATLLATITFTAGFSLPRGFNNDTGEAVLAKKTTFLVFLIADTYAMCFSMLILFSIIWSLVYDSNRSSFLANRSLGLLKHSLHGTLAAFMTGVYLVTYKKSMWIAIAVIIMCSLAVILSQRRILYKMFETMNSVTEKAHKMQMQLPSSWEQWTSYLLFEVNGDFWGKQRPIASNNQGQDEEAIPLILDSYRSTEEGAAGQKPWLGLDQCLRTPLHTALTKKHVRVALDILSMDVVLLPTMEDIEGRSPLAIAMESGFNRVALQILTSSPNCSFSECDGCNALFYAARCSALEYGLNSNVIASHLRRDFIDQLSMLNHTGNNSLQFVGVSAHDDALILKILIVLVTAYKQERAELFSSSEFQPPWLQKNLNGVNALDRAIGTQRRTSVILLVVGHDQVS
ncbi:hypothetical protein Cgig2_028932 [Carnegiea gigantea]|uniref:PGG domain-containing protein n=1 Tax=Carnegiea gigantea TaxID=171969 RepID=A0A9Q1KSL5_9CARY|nr:hypothetical protein Cgig2_028932 [Carnegiea gigantea]